MTTSLAISARKTTPAAETATGSVLPTARTVNSAAPVHPTLLGDFARVPVRSSSGVRPTGAVPPAGVLRLRDGQDSFRGWVAEVEACPSRLPTRRQRMDANGGPGGSRRPIVTPFDNNHNCHVDRRERYPVCGDHNLDTRGSVPD